MKKVILILFVGFFALNINAQTKEEIKKDFKGPIFQFENEVIDYGEIAQNSAIIFSILICLIEFLIPHKMNKNSFLERSFLKISFSLVLLDFPYLF